VRVLVANLSEVNRRAVEVEAMTLRVEDPLGVVPVVSLNAGMHEPMLPPHLVALVVIEPVAAANTSVPTVIVTSSVLMPTIVPAVGPGILDFPWTSAGALSISVELTFQARLTWDACVDLLIHLELALEMVTLLAAHPELAFAGRHLRGVKRANVLIPGAFLAKPHGHATPGSCDRRQGGQVFHARSRDGKRIES